HLFLVHRNFNKASGGRCLHLKSCHLSEESCADAGMLRVSEKVGCFPRIVSPGETFPCPSVVEKLVSVVSNRELLRSGAGVRAQFREGILPSRDRRTAAEERHNAIGVVNRIVL